MKVLHAIGSVSQRKYDQSNLGGLLRAAGLLGVVFFAGMLIMAYNVFKTVTAQKPAPVAVLDPA